MEGGGRRHRARGWPHLPPTLAPTVGWLASSDLDGYGPRPIPDPADTRIDALVDAVLADPAWLGPAVAASIDGDPRPFALTAYSERVAARAVRDRRPADLSRALLAIALAFNGAADWRDVMLFLPLPWRSAELLDADPAALYAQVAELPTGLGTRFVRGFLDRSPADRRIGAMGFREGEDAGGFRYVSILGPVSRGNPETA